MDKFEQEAIAEAERLGPDSPAARAIAKAKEYREKGLVALVRKGDGEWIVQPFKPSTPPQQSNP